MKTKKRKIGSMCSISIEYRNMNATNTKVHQAPKSDGELYLLIIVVKLAILMAIKIGQTLVHVYKMHNRAVIKKHDDVTIARLRKLATAVDNVESV